MSGFDEREKGYEAKYEHDQELAFRVKARRNHLIGLWAADKLGHQGAAAEAYAMQIADPASHLHGDAEIIKKIAADFAAKGIAIDTTRINLELERFAGEARKAFGAK